MRLRQQLDLLDKKEDEAVSAEYASIEQEAAEAEALKFPADISGFSLSPSTWNAINGGFDLSSEFWNVDSVRTVAGGSGSS